MADLFIYGTLGHLPLLRAVLGDGAQGLTIEAARLEGWQVSAVAGEIYPTIAPQEGAQARGLLLMEMGAKALARADFYEDLARYHRTGVEVTLRDGTTRRADVYVPDGSEVSLGAWQAEEWAARWGELSVLAAEEVMRWHGVAPPREVAGRYGVIATRAQARLNARQTAPATLRREAGRRDLEILSCDQPYARFFTVEDYKLRHRRFDGALSETIERAVFVSADSATVLPYDPRLDRVMLVEQLRVGPVARGDGQPWVLEPIAGRVDPGESPEDCAHREALEEAGLKLERLIRVAGYYPSPGANSEYLHSFLGLADLADGAEGLGGVPGEGEDIRAHVLPFARAMELLESGEINIGTTVTSLMFLAARRARLRAGQGGGAEG